MSDYWSKRAPDLDNSTLYLESSTCPDYKMVAVQGDEQGTLNKHITFELELCRTTNRTDCASMEESAAYF